MDVKLVLNTKETEFNKVFLVKFYNILDKALENEGEEVFCHLKRNIRPDVTKDVDIPVLQPAGKYFSV